MHNFKLLGGLTIQKNGKSAPIAKSPKGSALLAYLLLQKTPQSREFIADLFWDAMSTKQALAALRALVMRTRRQAPELEVSRHKLSIIPLPSTVVDIHQLEKGLASNDLNEIDQGLTHYKGPLLADLYLSDAPRFNEWLLLTREQWHQKAWLGYTKVCQAHMEQKQWLSGIEVARRWLHIDPLDETPLQFLLQFLGHNGQGKQAWQQYEFSRQLLWNELGVEPTAQTTEIAQTVCQHHPKQTYPIYESTTEPAYLPSNSLIPYQRNFQFIGREKSLTAVADAFLSDNQEPRPHAVAITGMGGLGKTQLAVEFCYRYGRFFSGGCFWINFANEHTLEEEIVKIGGEGGMELYRDAEKLTQTDRLGRIRRAWQEATPRLLIFDNCESPELLTQWLPVTGGCRVLLTSRRGQWTQELNILTHPLATLTENESVILLKQLADHLDSDNAAEIAREIGHLPLALYLAGRFLNRYRQITPAQYINQLRDGNLLNHPSLQGRGITYSPTDHDLHIARTFALTFHQLNDHDEVDVMAKKILGSLTHFAHGDPLTTQFLFACLCNDPSDFLQELLLSDGLNRLIELGIVRPEGDHSIQIHRLLATYAQTELAHQLEASLEHVLRHTVSQIEQQFNQTRFLGRFPVAAVHIQTLANTVANRNDHPSVSLQLYWGRHLRDIGAGPEAHDFFTAAVQRHRQQIDEPDLLLAELINVLGTLTWELGDMEKAWPHYQEALAIRQQLLGTDHTLTAQSMQNLAILHSRSGQLAEASSYYMNALEIYSQLEPPDRQQMGFTTYNLSLLHRRTGDINLIVKFAGQSLKIRQEILPADSPHIAQSLSMLAYGHYLQGDYEKATQIYEQALQIRQDIHGDKHPTTLGTLTSLGLVNSLGNQKNLAETQLTDAWQKVEQHLSNTKNLMGVSCSYLGRHYFKVGDFAQATSYLQQAADIQATQKNINSETSRNLFYLTQAHLRQGNLDTAQQLLAKQQKWLADSLPSNHIEVAYSLWAEGDILTAAGDHTAAQNLYRQAITLFKAKELHQHPDLIEIEQRLAS